MLTGESMPVEVSPTDTGFRRRTHSPREAFGEAAATGARTSSRDEDTRGRGYEFFKEGLSEALFCSCLNYGSLTGRLTDPLVDIVVRAVEFWAASFKIQGAAANTSTGMPRP